VLGLELEGRFCGLVSEALKSRFLWASKGHGLRIMCARLSKEHFWTKSSYKDNLVLSTEWVAETDMEVFENWAYWIPTGLVLGLVAFFRKSASEWFSEYLKSYFSSELKRVEHDFKESEIRLSASIARQDKSIEHLQSGVLSNLTSRNLRLYEKRLNALDTIWEVIVESGRFKSLIQIVYTFNLDAVFDDEKASSVISDLLKKTLPIEKNTLDFFNKATFVRPHISVLVWAYYRAYEAIVAHGCAIALVLQTRVPSKFLSDGADVKILIHTVLPQLSDAPDKLDLRNSLKYLDLIEHEILEAIKHDLNGTDLDHSQVKKAKQILEIANNLSGQLNTA